MVKCPDCGKCFKPAPKFPLSGVDGQGKKVFYWRNLLAVDKKSLFTLIVLALLIYGYQHDTAVCKAFEGDPCGFCDDVMVECEDFVVFNFTGIVDEGGVFGKVS